MVTPDKRKTHPIISAILSVVLVGLGQMINGQLGKGLVMFMIAALIRAIFANNIAGASTAGAKATMINNFSVINVIIFAVSAIDAYICCKKLRDGQSIGKFSFF